MHLGMNKVGEEEEEATDINKTFPEVRLDYRFCFKTKQNMNHANQIIFSSTEKPCERSVQK